MLRRTGWMGLVMVAACSSAACSSAANAPPTTSGRAIPPAVTTSASTARTGAGSPPATAGDWTTYQHDRGRTGVATGRLGPAVRRLWANTKLDGSVYAQPLLDGGAVIVATEGDSLYSLDAVTGAVRWRTNMGRSVPLSELPCGDIDPTGITGTPVVDPSAALVWAVAFVEPHRHELVAVDLATGAVRARRGVDPPGADPVAAQQRAALALANGQVYVAFGGLYGDCGSYRGWVVASPAALGATSPALLAWAVPTSRGGGIWAPAGPAVDTAGQVYVATGNSFGGGRYDEGNSVVVLSPTLTSQATFAPTNWAQLNASDTDVGSISPALVGGGRLFQSGKDGMGYLLDTAHLGGIGGALFQAPVCRAGAYGAAAWAPPLVLIPCKDGLVAVRVGPGDFSVAWRSETISAGPPVVTDGIAWTVDLGSGRLLALDLATGATIGRIGVGHVPHFAAPAVGSGRIVVPSGHGVVAFGN